MRLAVGFNPVMPVSEAVRIGQRAESLGYESMWLHESLYQRDAVTYLSSILGSTTHLRVGSGVINTFTRHPIVAATTFGKGVGFMEIHGPWHHKIPNPQEFAAIMEELSR